MKMKLIDLSLATLLAGVSLPALAQDQSAPLPAPAAAADEGLVCSEESCTDSDGFVFRLRTRSYARPVTSGTDEHSSSATLQPDRRVSIAMEQPGQATALGKFSVSLPNGGVIWATEDPTLGQPELSVSAPSMVAYDGTRIVEPVQFFVTRMP